MMVRIGETLLSLNCGLRHFPRLFFIGCTDLKKIYIYSATFQGWCQVNLTTSYHREARIMKVLVTEARQRES